MSNRTFKIRQFSEWIEANGGRVLNLTNEWEVLRYKMPEKSPLVVYRNKAGKLNIPDDTWSHYQAFLAGAPASFVTRATGKKRSRLVANLLARDGETCCLCGQFLNDDITVEHFLEIDAGGSNDPRNLGLAHKCCNSAVGRASVVEKIKCREAMIAQQETVPPWEFIEPARIN